MALQVRIGNGPATLAVSGTIYNNNRELPVIVDFQCSETRMDTPSLSMRDLARRLLAANHTASGSHVDAAVLVSEKLQISLTKFAGAAGFAALVRRALALAREEVPSLQSVKIGADGRIEGFEQIVAGAARGEAAIAITAHLLELLVTFIGESFTMRLVREAWPDTALDDEHTRIEPNS
jgi:hypothetical protein